MKIAYDFHIHTALSPCGDDDMTPNNIVNMAILKKLDAIAITDHNTCKNVLPCIKAAENSGLTVLPGMEVETAEEVHMICLFKDINSAAEFEAVVKKNMPSIKNNVDIFGRQLIFDDDDTIIGTHENMLVTATYLSINDVAAHVSNLGGAVFPAHIDKSSYSIISNLGFIPEDMSFKAVEIKNKQNTDILFKPHNLDKYTILTNSDAHYLWDISEKENYLDVNGNEISEIIGALKII